MMPGTEIRRLKRSECAVLHLGLKSHWYRMIDSGVKKVEFREATPYWDVRVANWIRRWKRATCDEPGKIPVLEFQNGYGRFSPHMAFIAGGAVYDVLDAKTPVRHKELGEFPKKRYVFFIGERVTLEYEPKKNEANHALYQR